MKAFALAFFVSVNAFCNPCLSLFNGSTPRSLSLDKYYRSTLNSLELMRSTESGLINDKIEVDQRTSAAAVVAHRTSASNIALDLIILADLNSTEKISKIIRSLELIPFHHKTGLFFSWYSTEEKLHPVNNNISSVDNLHLAEALWMISNKYQETELGSRAKALLDRMDFSIYFDSKKHLIGGNLRFHHNDWYLEDYRYSNFGSEARQLYTIGWALGLFRKIPDAEFLKSISSLKMEIFHWKENGFKPLLRTWDGGAFQMLLPELLIGEHLYSPMLKELFRNYTDYIIWDATRNGSTIPFAFSACNFTQEINKTIQGHDIPEYNEKAGTKDLVSRDHQELKDPHYERLWDAVVTPHAFFLASLANPSKLLPTIETLEGFSHNGTNLYLPNLGWMDGVWVRPPHRNEIINVQLALDQGMIALSTRAIQNEDGLSPTARLFHETSEIQERLKEVYNLINERLERLISSR